MSEGRNISILLAVSAVLGFLWHYMFFSGEEDDANYVYWEGTVILTWIDASTGQNDYGVGRGRYEVRLINGRHIEARTYLKEKLRRLDCVKIRQRLKFISYAPTYEIIGKVDDCWQPN